MGDYNQNERFDAFELGRVAGRNLQRQNHPMAAVLPEGLHALFSDQEFRDCMVVGGVTSERPLENGEQPNEPWASPKPLYQRETRQSSRWQFPTSATASTTKLTRTLQDRRRIGGEPILVENPLPVETVVSNLPVDGLTHKPLYQRETRQSSRGQIPTSALASTTRSTRSIHDKRLISEDPILVKNPLHVETVVSNVAFPVLELVISPRDSCSSTNSDTVKKRTPPQHREYASADVEPTAKNRIPCSPFKSINSMDDGFIMVYKDCENTENIYKQGVYLTEYNPNTDTQVEEIEISSSEVTETNKLYEVDYGTKDLKQSETVDNENDGSEKTGTNEESELCLTCREYPSFQEIQELPEISKKNVIARELLWIALGMKKKFYDRSTNSFHFCENCTEKVTRIMEICELIGNLEDEFNNLRHSICEQMIAKFVPMTPSVEKLETLQKLNKMKTNVLKKMKISYEKIHPGKRLLEQAMTMTSKINENIHPDIKGPTDNSGSHDETGYINEDCTGTNEKLLRTDESQEIEIITDFEEDSHSEEVKSKTDKERYGFETKELETILEGKPANDGHDFNGQSIMEFNCPKCAKKYKTGSSLKIHLQHHISLENGIYQCKLCDKKCSTKSELQSHQSIHSGKKPFECNYCDKSYISKKAKLNHERSHGKTTSFSCKICNKTYSSKISLGIHQRIHTGDKPYKCRHCEKSFNQKTNYDDHQRRHQGFKPFECMMCSTRFHRMRNVNAHFRKQHPNNNVELHVKRHSMKSE